MRLGKAFILKIEWNVKDIKALLCINFKNSELGKQFRIHGEFVTEELDLSKETKITCDIMCKIVYQGVFSEEEWQDILHMLKGGSGHAVLYLTDDRPAFCNIAEFKMLAGRKEILFLSLHAFAAHIRHMPDKYRTVLSANQKAKIRHDKRVSEMFKKYKNKNKVNEHNYDWRDKLFKTVKS